MKNSANPLTSNVVRLHLSASSAITSCFLVRRIIFLDGPGRRSDHTANVVACKEARGVADHVQAVWALLTERCAALKTLLRSRWHRVVIMTRADEDPAASRGQRRSGSGRVLAERSSPERRALPLAARLAAGAVGLVALAGIVAAAGAVCASRCVRKLRNLAMPAWPCLG